MRVLELFSGTHSFGKVCKENGWDVVSLDIDGRATINEDILTWDYTVWGKFDIIWASPPCDDYSCMNYCRPEKKLDLTHANNMVKKTLEIIDYFKPKYWFIENPQTGMLKKQDFIKDIPYYDVDYCMYGGMLRKRTRIWTNLVEGFSPKLCNRKCGIIKDGRHPSFSYMNISGVNRLDLRHTIPPELIKSLLLKICSTESPVD